MLVGGLGARGILGAMFREGLTRPELDQKAEAMRRSHSEWLSSAFKRGMRPAQIPTRKVSDGGWTALMRTPEGRAWAEEFWQGALLTDGLGDGG
jgi:hypothetical protein